MNPFIFWARSCSRMGSEQFSRVGSLFSDPLCISGRALRHSDSLWFVFLKTQSFIHLFAKIQHPIQHLISPLKVRCLSDVNVFSYHIFVPQMFFDFSCTSVVCTCIFACTSAIYGLCSVFPWTSVGLCTRYQVPHQFTSILAHPCTSDCLRFFLHLSCWSLYLSPSSDKPFPRAAVTKWAALIAWEIRLEPGRIRCRPPYYMCLIQRRISCDCVLYEQQTDT